MKKNTEVVDFHSKTLYEAPECELLDIDFDPCVTHNATSLEKLIGNKPAYILQTKEKASQLYYTDGQGRVVRIGNASHAEACRDYFSKKANFFQKNILGDLSQKDKIDAIESETGFTRNSLLKEKITRLLYNVNGIYEEFKEKIKEVGSEMDKNALGQMKMECKQLHKFIKLITLFDENLSKFNNKAEVSSSGLSVSIFQKEWIQEVFLEKQPLIKIDSKYGSTLNPSDLTCDIKAGAYIFHNNTLYFAKHKERYREMDVPLDKKSISHFKDYRCTHVNGYFLQLWSSKNPFIIKFIKSLEVVKEFETHYDQLFCFIGKKGQINEMLPDCIKGLGQIIGLMYDAVCNNSYYENTFKVDKKDPNNTSDIRKQKNIEKRKELSKKYKISEEVSDNRNEDYSLTTDSTSKCSAYLVFQAVTSANGLKIAGVTLLIIGAIAALAGGVMLGLAVPAVIHGLAWVAQALLIGGGVAVGAGVGLGIAGIFKSSSAGKDVVNNQSDFAFH